MHRFALAALILSPLACAPPPASEETKPRTVRISVLPDQSDKELLARYTPLIDYLRAATGLEVILDVPVDYEAMLESFDRGEIDLAWFGGVTFVNAEHRSGAVPLVTRDVDQRFTSSFVVHDSTNVRSIDELSGKTLAFGPELSTSGHVMPRYFLERRGIEPDKMFAEVRHSSGHDETARWVQDGQADLGAVNSVIIESMQADGRLAVGELREIWSTPPYQNYVWAHHPDLDPVVHNRLMDAFLALDVTNVEHAPILQRLGARGFLPVGSSDYDALRAALGVARRPSPR